MHKHCNGFSGDESCGGRIAHRGCESCFFSYQNSLFLSPTKQTNKHVGNTPSINKAIVVTWKGRRVPFLLLLRLQKPYYWGGKFKLTAEEGIYIVKI